MSTSKFSSALVLTDLDDFITPSQACIKPVESSSSSSTSTSAKDTQLRVNADGAYVEVGKDGAETVLAPASITLNDCLACSGCITSAESVLVSQQSHTEVKLELAKNRMLKATGQDASVVVFSVSPQARASLAVKYKLSLVQTSRKLTHFLKHNAGASHVFDTSFSRDFSLFETAREFVERYRRAFPSESSSLNHSSSQSDVNLSSSSSSSTSSKSSLSATSRSTESLGVETKPLMLDTNSSDDSKPIASRRVVRGGLSSASKACTEKGIPLLASACPGWICYAEKTHGFILPLVSSTKSPQQIMGSIVKDHLATKINVQPNRIYHVSIMPCFDKKLEASRPDFFNQELNTRDVDMVITTSELDKWFEEESVNFVALEESDLDEMFPKFTRSVESEMETLLGTEGTGAGGYLEYTFRYAAEELFGVKVDELKYVAQKNQDFQEVTLEVDGKVLLRFAAVYGFRNIQNVVRKIKMNNSPLHFVEIMACPGGCNNGGGQIRPDDPSKSKDLLQEVERVYKDVKLSSPESNSLMMAMYQEWLNGVGNDKVKKLLHTQYRAVEKSINPLNVKW